MKYAYRAVSINAVKQMISTANGERATYTSNENPSICNNEIGKRSISQPNPKLTIQIASVLHVSVKLRAVALTCLVTLSPKKLNNEMLIATITPDQRTAGLPTVWCQPRVKSKKGERAVTEGIESIGMKMRIVMKPNSPSNPTATSGATA